MLYPSSVLKILALLRSRRGVASRFEITEALARHVTAAQLDLLLVTDLAALVEIRKARVSKKGRTPVLWVLAQPGWAIANQVAADGSPLVLSHEELVRQMNNAAQLGDSWASELLEAQVIVGAMKAAPPPSVRDLKDFLFRMYSTDNRAHKKLARRFLVRLGEVSTLRQIDERVRTEMRAKRRSKRKGRPLDADAIRRINQARSNKGMGPMVGVETPIEIAPAPIVGSLPFNPVPLASDVDADAEPETDYTPTPFVPRNTRPALLPNGCRHRPGKPDGSCVGHCSSPLYAPLR
jgi:hypothetical protein